MTTFTTDIENLTLLIDKQAQLPLATHISGTVTYVISGLVTVGSWLRLKHQ